MLSYIMERFDDTGDTNCAITPINKSVQKLGLRRSRALSKNAPTQPTSDRTQPDNNVKKPNEEYPAGTSSPRTPLFATECSISQLSSNSNAQQYKLSLSRRIRNKFKKRRLEFSPLSSPDGEKENAASVKRENLFSRMSEIGEVSDERRKSLEADNNKDCFDRQVEMKSFDIDSHYTTRITQLKEAIYMWKSAFKAISIDLSSKMNTTEEDLLCKFNIPTELLRHLDDD